MRRNELIAMGDRELLEAAARAAGIRLHVWGNPGAENYANMDPGSPTRWNPLTDDGDRYRLAQKLKISIDFSDCFAWHRRPSGSLIQEFWGGECGDEAHAILRAAAEIGQAEGDTP